MSPLKKSIILQKENVETVGSFGLCFINPPIGGLIVSYVGIELFFS